MIKTKHGYILLGVLMIANVSLVWVGYKNIITPLAYAPRTEVVNGVCALDVGPVSPLVQLLDLEKLGPVFEQRVAFSSSDVVHDGWSQERVDFDCLRPLFTDAGWNDFLTYAQKQKEKIARWRWNHAWRKPYFTGNIPLMNATRHGFDVIFSGEYRDGVYDVIDGGCPFAWHLSLISTPSQTFAIDKFTSRESWACEKADFKMIWIQIKGLVQGRLQNE